MPNLGAPELIIILVIVLLVFGGSKLPKLARSLGEAKNEFEKTSKPGADKTPASEEKVTMTKTELDALLAERDATARKE
jgi:sec-independent protein translocase protein TatA